MAFSVEGQIPRWLRDLAPRLRPPCLLPGQGCVFPRAVLSQGSTGKGEDHLLTSPVPRLRRAQVASRDPAILPGHTDWRQPDSARWQLDVLALTDPHVSRFKKTNRKKQTTR